MKDLHNTKEEDLAIKLLEQAFKKCSKIGIKFSVMDNDLLYANKRLYKECLKIENKVLETSYASYPTVAYAQDTNIGYNLTVDCHKSMESCGGW